MKKIHKFFSKDLLHILGAVGIFVAFLISIAYKQVGIVAYCYRNYRGSMDYRHPQSRPAEKRKDCFRKS